MRRSGRRVFVAAVGSLGLLAAACGGDDGGGESAKIDESFKGEVQSQRGGGATTTAAPSKAPTTMEEWFSLWETERAAVVKRVKDNGWGLSADGRTVTGPEGFTIDLNKCASGWSNTEGLSDNEIKIGLTIPQSGTLADYGNLGRAFDVIWAYQNDNGGIADSTGKAREIRMITKDDAYDPARTIPLVDELIDSEKVFAVWSLGSPNTLKIYDKLNQRCIPNPYAMTAHPAWGDPVNHPWTTGHALAYTSEAILWGTFIEEHLEELTADDGKVTVGALVMNNDFGKAYDVGFKGFLAQSPVKSEIDYVVETIEPSAPTIKDPMTTIASKNPDVFIAMTAGTSCTQAVTEAAENGMKDSVKYLFTGQPCKPATFVGKDKVGGDGSASDGWWIAGGGTIDLNSPANDTNPWVVWARQQLASRGLDYKSSGSFSNGFAYGWAFWQAVQIASQLDGGLSRTNFVLAMRTLDMTNPNLIPGIKFNMNGNADAYPIEGSEFAKYDYTKQTWVQQGEIVELSGKSTNCAWDQSIGNCR